MSEVQAHKQETCEERVNDARDSRMADLRAMLAPTREMVEVIDDGTLDTVVGIPCIDIEVRLSTDYASAYRDEETGELDLDSLLDDEFDNIQEQCYERYYEYGLAFDYVEGDTDYNPDAGYWWYQISYGGPSEEIRFYGELSGEYDGRLGYAEFWFKGWFDGASVRLYGEDLEVAEIMFQEFVETGTAHAVRAEAIGD